MGGVGTLAEYEVCSMAGGRSWDSILGLYLELYLLEM